MLDERYLENLSSIKINYKQVDYIDKCMQEAAHKLLNADETDRKTIIDLGFACLLKEQLDKYAIELDPTDLLELKSANVIADNILKGYYDSINLSLVVNCQKLNRLMQRYNNYPTFSKLRRMYKECELALKETI